MVHVQRVGFLFDTQCRYPMKYGPGEVARWVNSMIRGTMLRGTMLRGTIKKQYY
jgi:hypothetical protein